MEQEIIQTMSRLLEKMGIENAIPSIPVAAENKDKYLEAALISLKGLHAGYDKSDALSQIQWLMHTYNIQIDELIERISS
jgi:hypothetical protein